MSKNSKAKRDAKRKKLPTRGHGGHTSRQIEPHGEMKDSTGRVIAGIGRQASDWVLVIGNQVIGGGASAAEVMAMFHCLADIQQKDGGSISHAYSSEFQAEAERDALEQGMTLDAYVERARAEMAKPEDEGSDGAEDDEL